MQVFKYVKKLQETVATQRKAGKRIGFVPTMGALHKGHTSLIERAIAENDYVICSIFVNPTQFNDATDLVKYPRTINADLGKLYAAECSAVFVPTVAEIYPENAAPTPVIDFGKLMEVLEGAHRPGHFDGMVQVVHRLLDIARPDTLYMGQKDYQQQAIIRHMLKAIASDIQLNTCETIREKDGLAMSSRNTRLTEAQRAIASTIHATLTSVAEKTGKQSIQDLEIWAMEQLTKKGFVVDYFSIVDGNSLQPIETVETAETVVAATAAYLGDIRLIDNLIL